MVVLKWMSIIIAAIILGSAILIVTGLSIWCLSVPFTKFSTDLGWEAAWFVFAMGLIMLWVIVTTTYLAIEDWRDS